MLYLIGQGDHFFERSDGGSGDSGGIWRTLCRDIGLTPEQEERLKAALKCVATARPPCMVGVLLPLTAWRLRMCGVCVCAWQEGARHTQACVGDEDAGERRGMGLCGVVLRGMATSPRELMTPPHAQDFVVRFRKSMFDRAAELDSQMSGMYSVLAPAQVRARHDTFALYTCPTHSSGVAGGCSQAMRYMLWVERNRGRLQTGLGSGGNASSARPASGVKTAASPRVATGSGATAGAGGGASVSALIGAARSTAAPAGSASGASVQQLDTARLEDVLLQKPDGDLTMADLGILATPTPGARNAGPGAAAPRSQ